MSLSMNNHTRNEEIIISYSLTKDVVTLHEPVLIDFKIENRTDHLINFDLGHNKKSNFKFSLEDKSGVPIKEIKELSTEGIGLIGKIKVPSGGMYNQVILFDEWYKFEKPGKYIIKSELTNFFDKDYSSYKLTYNKLLNVNVKPRDEKELNKICKSLADTAINGETKSIRDNAAFTLSYINDIIAVPYLKDIINKSVMVSRLYAVYGLSRIANREAVDLLLLALKDKDSDVKIIAKRELKRIYRTTNNAEIKKVIKDNL